MLVGVTGSSGVFLQPSRSPRCLSHWVSVIPSWSCTTAVSATETKAEASESPATVGDDGGGTGPLASADGVASDSASDVRSGGVETGSATGGGAPATVLILTSVDALAVASRRAWRIATAKARITMAAIAHKAIRVAEFNFIRSPINGQRNRSPNRLLSRGDFRTGGVREKSRDQRMVPA